MGCHGGPFLLLRLGGTSVGLSWSCTSVFFPFSNTDTSPWVGAPDASSSWFDHICKDPHFQITCSSQVKTSRAWVNSRCCKPQSLSGQDMSQSHAFHGALSTASLLLTHKGQCLKARSHSLHPASLLSPLFPIIFKKCMESCIVRPQKRETGRFSEIWKSSV